MNRVRSVDAATERLEETRSRPLMVLRRGARVRIALMRRTISSRLSESLIRGLATACSHEGWVSSVSMMMTVAGVDAADGAAPICSCSLMKAVQLGSLAQRHSTHWSMPATRPDPAPDQPALLQPSAWAPLGTLQMYAWQRSHTPRFPADGSGVLHVLQAMFSLTVVGRAAGCDSSGPSPEGAAEVVVGLGPMACSPTFGLDARA